jgi:hypothetical protein
LPTALVLDANVYITKNVYMSVIIHARLDARTRQIMQGLKRRYGWSDSEIVRQGIRALGETDLPPQERRDRIVGLGKFASGLPDLGSNKDHLRDFGR